MWPGASFTVTLSVEERCMGVRFVRCLAVMALMAVLPSIAHAQSAITGTIRDASGAVLPGVTVEAASPVLIEKVRSTVTDGTGGLPPHGTPARHL